MKRSARSGYSVSIYHKPLHVVRAFLIIKKNISILYFCFGGEVANNELITGDVLGDTVSLP